MQQISTKEIKQRAKIEFRKLWSNINRENQHLTTEKIEDLIDSIIDWTIENDRKQLKFVGRVFERSRIFVEGDNKGDIKWVIDQLHKPF